MLTIFTEAEPSECYFHYSPFSPKHLERYFAMSTLRAVQQCDKTQIPSAHKSELSITKCPPTLILAYLSSCNANVEQRRELVAANQLSNSLPPKENPYVETSADISIR